MRVLITGHLGFIGTHLRSLIEDETPSWEQEFELIGWDTRTDHPVTCRDLDLIRADKIVNLGATLHGVSKEKTMLDEDLAGFVTVYADKTGCPVFHASSIAAAHRITEAEPFGYAWRKICQEDMILDSVKNHHTTCARFNNVFGPGQTRPSLYGEMLWSHVTGEPLKVHGDGSQVRSWLRVDDVCRKIIHWLQEESHKPGILMQEWTGVSATVSEFINTMETSRRLDCGAHFAGHLDHGADEPPISNDDWELLQITDTLR